MHSFKFLINLNLLSASAIVLVNQLSTNCLERFETINEMSTNKQMNSHVKIAYV